MRAWLLLCAALALATRRATAAHPHPHSARADRIKTLILAKLGLSERPTPLGAPPRDVVRQILARAVDQHPPAHDHEADTAMREGIVMNKVVRGTSKLLAEIDLDRGLERCGFSWCAAHTGAGSKGAPSALRPLMRHLQRCVDAGALKDPALVCAAHPPPHPVASTPGAR